MIRTLTKQGLPKHQQSSTCQLARSRQSIGLAVP